MFEHIFGNSSPEKNAQSEAHFVQGAAHAFLARLEQAAVVTDTGGIVRYLNEPAIKLTAWPEAEALGKSINLVVDLAGTTNGRLMDGQVAHSLSKGIATSLRPDSILIRRDGTEIAVEGSVTPIQDMDNRPAGTLVLLQDVTRVRKVADNLAHEARHDALTGLVNRREFQRRLEAAFAGTRSRNEHHALCYLDLDRFKVINDSCGHAAGDELLRKVTQLLKSLLRGDETLARLGGDEFGLLVQNVSLDDAVKIADRMLAAIKAFRFDWQGRTFGIGVSIGVTAMTRKSTDLNSVVSLADAACYAAKENGRNRVQVHNPDDIERDNRQEEMRAVSRITSALDESRFVLYQQPIIPVCAAADGSQHCEILVRMVNADGTLLQPAQFIPAAERYNLMPGLDRWIIRHVFEVFHRRFPTRELKRTQQWSINISGASLSSEGFVDFIRDEAARHEIVPESICFEITETTAIANLQRASDFLWGLRLDGFKFALDHFGIGMSSFSYLKSLPVDYVKIDGEFVKNILDEKISLAMTEAITRVVGVMGIQVVAEYVENELVLEKLREIGVGYAQGYGVSEPVLLEETGKIASLAEFRVRKWGA